MSFEQLFNMYIKGQKAVGFGFQFLERVKQPNGYFREVGGYFTEYENGYKMIFNGESLGQTPVQEVLILDPAGIPIARDTEDLKRKGE